MNPSEIFMYEGKLCTVEELLKLPEGRHLLREHVNSPPYFTKEKQEILNKLKFKEMKGLEDRKQTELNKFFTNKSTTTMSDQELRLEILKIVIAFASQTKSNISINDSLEETNKIYDYIKNGKLTTNVESKTE